MSENCLESDITSRNYVSWLKDYLLNLSQEIDIDVLSDYITGILDCPDLSVSEVTFEVRTLLSDYLADDLCQNSAEEIIQHYLRTRDGDDIACSAAGSSVPLDIEERMRVLVRAHYEQQQQETSSEPIPKSRVRDVCTTAILREYGAAGYQGDSEEEKEAEIAITNADFEAKLKLGLADDIEGWTQDATGAASEVEIDLDELEDVSGYAKRDNVKPGTVQNALSVLNPSLYGSCSNGLSNTQPGAARVTSSNASVTVISRLHSDNVESERNLRNRPDKKKKAHVLSKRVARVGAQAEAKQLNCRTEKASGDRNRLDQMDAFLLSDSGGESEENASPTLPDGGNNRERVIFAEQAARRAAATAAAEHRTEGKNVRQRQLDQAVRRKQIAQKKAQKVERRR